MPLGSVPPVQNGIRAIEVSEDCAIPPLNQATRQVPARRVLRSLGAVAPLDDIGTPDPLQEAWDKESAREEVMRV